MKALFALSLDRHDLRASAIMLGKDFPCSRMLHPEHPKWHGSFRAIGPFQNRVPVLDGHGERLLNEIERQTHTPGTNTGTRPATQRPVKLLAMHPKTLPHSVAESCGRMNQTPPPAATRTLAVEL